MSLALSIFYDLLFPIGLSSSYDDSEPSYRVVRMAEKQENSR